MSNRVLLSLVLTSSCVALYSIAAVGGPILPVFLLIAACSSAFHTLWLFVVQEIDLHAHRREVFERLLKAPAGNRVGSRRFSLVSGEKRGRYAANSPVAKNQEAWLPKVSVIVPAKNEAAVIEQTVRHLFNSDYPDFDVLIVDDDSDDATPKILDRLKTEFANLNVLRLEKGHPAGKSFVLNEALNHCNGEVIAVFDADAVMNPEFLRAMVAQLEPPEVGAVQAQKRISNAKYNLLTRCQDYEYAFDTSLQGGRNALGGVAELRGNGQLIKRFALNAVGGWNNDSITDDLDMTMRLLEKGLRVEFTSRAVVWEEGITNVQGLFRQRMRWAEGSIRRFLDYLVPLYFSDKLNVRQRLDMIGYSIQFVWPLSTAFGLLNEMGHAVSAEQTYYRLLLASFLSCGLGVFSYVFWSIRTHRPPASVGSAAKYACITSIYFFALWCPCILFSLYKILTQKKASAWALTQHQGTSAA